jgi:hypothetical protein
VDSVAMEGGTLVLGVTLGEESRTVEIHPRARYSKERLYIPVAAENGEWKKELIQILLQLAGQKHRPEQAK